MKNRNIPVCIYLVVALTTLSLGCHEAAFGYGRGAECEENSDCRDPYVCQYGRCRSECTNDQDCPDGSCVRSLEDPNASVCTLPGEKGCANDGDCPDMLYCGADGLCRSSCDNDDDCPGNRICYRHTCFDSVPECVSEQEKCDGQDNDCDGDTDEDLGTISCGKGICRVTVDACHNGEEAECVPSNPASEETCDGTDDDCDGEVDEGCSCQDGDVQDCYTGAGDTRRIGECKDGTQSCVNGRWKECEGDQTPNDEVCNGKDDDCDGVLDGSEELIQECGSDVGECSTGTETCQDDGSWAGCDAVEPTTETCNGKDDDCDGVLDGSEELTQECGSDVGECSTGIETCQDDGSWTGCDDKGPTTEICNGKDDDCDGVLDGSEELTRQCGSSDIGVCSYGTETCQNDGSWANCDAVEATTEICNGDDDDCDNRIDEELGTVTCGQGICQVIVNHCENGSVVPCVPGDSAPEETCDGTDDDCDGDVDEGCNCIDDEEQECYTGSLETRGVGECRSGTQICIDGQWGLCDGDFTPAGEMCNGKDDDCDGDTDEDDAIDMIT